jgi:hypothetical protein
VKGTNEETGRAHVRKGDEREAFVTYDLLSKGFEVYSGHGKSSFDLVAYKHGELLRVEVKGLKNKRLPTGPVAGLGGMGVDCRRFDVLATVHNNRVYYNRSLLHALNTSSLELCGDIAPDKSITNKCRERRKLLEAKQ